MYRDLNSWDYLSPPLRESEDRRYRLCLVTWTLSKLCTERERNFKLQSTHLKDPVSFSTSNASASKRRRSLGTAHLSLSSNVSLIRCERSSIKAALLTMKKERPNRAQASESNRVRSVLGDLPRSYSGAIAVNGIFRYLLPEGPMYDSHTARSNRPAIHRCFVYKILRASSTSGRPSDSFSSAADPPLI